MFNMTPTHHVDSPLRRSGVGAIRTPIATPVVNDDEAERRESRTRESLLDSSTRSTVLHNEGLQNCLKIFNENKISKDNAWNMSLIDNFSVLIARHHKILNNFQVVGSTLEASSKIYGLRVDSVHTDVMRMSSGLTIHQVRNNENAEDQPSTDSQNIAQTNGENAAPKTKRRKTRRCTVTKSKESINAKLDTYALNDPIFAKLNSVVGSINSSDRLLQNVLTSYDSELRLRMDHKFWDRTDHEPIEHKDKYDYDKWTTLSTKLEISNKELLRPQNTGYRILDTPAEDDSKDETPPIDNNIDNPLDQSQLDVAFDMDADIEPIHDNDLFLNVDNDIVTDGLNETDHMALNACKGLRRKPVIVHDLRPIDSSSSQLEYSYRPLNNISQFWAGPSHWKFKRFRLSRPLTMRNSIPNRLPTKGMTRGKIEPIELQIDFDKSLFLDLKNKSAIKIRKVNVYKKWDAKQLKLPTHLHLNRNRFYEYSLAPGAAILISEPDSTPDIATSEYNYDNADDREYCSNTMPENDEDFTNQPDVMQPTQDEVMPEEMAVGEIATIFEGAPEMVEKIRVPYAKKAKVVDMKQLKKSCMSIIHRISDDASRISNDLPLKNSILGDEYKPGAVSFKKIYDNLPEILTKNMQEALSPAVAFYSILHLANEHKLRLLRDDNEYFIIRQIMNDK